MYRNSLWSDREILSIGWQWCRKRSDSQAVLVREREREREIVCKSRGHRIRLGRMALGFSGKSAIAAHFQPSHGDRLNGELCVPRPLQYRPKTGQSIEYAVYARISRQWHRSHPLRPELLFRRNYDPVTISISSVFLQLSCFFQLLRACSRLVRMVSISQEDRE